MVGDYFVCANSVKDIVVGVCSGSNSDRNSKLQIVRIHQGNPPKMSLSPRCFALAQIASLVGSINKKNYKANCAEIAKVK